MLGLHKHLLIIDTPGNIDNISKKLRYRLINQKKSYSITHIPEWDDYLETPKVNEFDTMTSLLRDYIDMVPYVLDQSLISHLERELEECRFLLAKDIKKILKEHKVPDELFHRFISSADTDKGIRRDIRTLVYGTIPRSFHHFIKHLSVYCDDRIYDVGSKISLTNIISIDKVVHLSFNTDIVQCKQDMINHAYANKPDSVFKLYSMKKLKKFHG